MLSFSKTRRDIFFALLATTIAALLFDYSCETGFPIAAYAIDDASFYFEISSILLSLSLEDCSISPVNCWKVIMDHAKDQIVNLPNLVSLIRILMAPVLYYFAFIQQPYWFIGVLLFAVFTDVLDGFLARILNQITTMGSRLDSWGDFIIYSTMATCAWILWPDIILREKLYFIIIILSLILPIIVGFIKFHSVISYHTWSAKLAVAITVLSYILLFTGLVDWPFKIAALFCLYAAIEEIAITILIRHELVDVRSIWQALECKRGNSNKNM